VTPEVLVRAGINESLARRTIVSLKVLDLLDEKGAPTKQWDDLRAARGDDEYQKRLQEWLRSVYSEVLQYANPETDSLARVTEAFRGYKPDGQRKAMALLLVGLWKYAGLPVPEEKGPGPSTPARPRPVRGPGPKSQRRREPEVGTARVVSAGDLPPGLVGLLQQIPRDGGGWTAQRRSGFLKAFEGVLDFSVPVVQDGADLTDEVATGVDSS
jgi:hypothetical protein